MIECKETKHLGGKGSKGLKGKVSAYIHTFQTFWG
jgi:hypothetical protein